MTLAAWADAKDPAADRARKAALELPPSATGHGVACPFPHADKAAYKGGRTNSEINAAIARASLKEVPLDGLRAIQHSVKAAAVLKYLDDPSTPSRQRTAFVPVDHPIVVQSGGERFIHDGHHRLTAHFLRGDERAKVRFVDFDAKEKR